MPSAKRYGVEVDGNLELENRLRRMEVKISQLLPSNQSSEELSRGAGVVPQVAGLRKTGTIVGGFSVNWNAVSISDLRRYEVQFATNEAFTADLQTFTAASVTYPFTTASDTNEVDPSWFVRVRAINQAGQSGAYSATLTAIKGQAGTDDIEDGAVTEAKVDPDVTVTISNIAAGTAGGQEGENKQGTVLWVGGFKLQFDTVNVATNTVLEVELPEPFTEDIYSVVSNAGSQVAGNASETSFGSWLVTGANRLTHVKLQNNLDSSSENITYWVVGKDT